MARACAICGKTPRFGNQVSHAHNISQRIWYPNLQRVRVAMKGARKRLRVCTRCIRSGAVAKSIS
ncbi:MAG TPA: 50S ribosomal protein L28 [Candidatus Polarisedimenticolia bacterium]|jgi:large subunit ribosomal protein L28|nr:50S ribosomal protein L28 [Candidatus Polarisedimenticolia bacterium]